MNSLIKWYLYGRFMLKLRLWDYAASQNNDILLSNSKTTRFRVQKYFRRDSEVLYPPIETKRFAKKITSEKFHNFFWDEKYYIILSALTEFKKLDIAIHAFKDIPEANLLIIWAGEYKSSLEGLAKNSQNIKLAGPQYWDNLVSLVQNSLWLIFPWEEDFWIVPIEIMAAGKPVFALHKWWLTETVLKWITWDFFQNPDWSDFIDNFKAFHKNNLENKYSEKKCRNQAAQFDESVFHEKLKKHIKH
jgi:glycosyltransferase involved in cell wall biosynthesis